MVPEMVKEERVTERYKHARCNNHEGKQEDVVSRAVGVAWPVLHAEVDGMMFEQCHHTQLSYI